MDSRPRFQHAAGMERAAARRLDHLLHRSQYVRVSSGGERARLAPAQLRRHRLPGVGGVQLAPIDAQRARLSEPGHEGPVSELDRSNTCAG